MLHSKNIRNFTVFFGTLLSLALPVSAMAKPDGLTLSLLCAGDNNQKISALRDITLKADAEALPLLAAMQNDSLHVLKDGLVLRCLIVKDGNATDALSGESLGPRPAGTEKITINNRVRSVLSQALATVRIVSDDADVRLAAINELRNAPDASMLPLLDRALKIEKNSHIKEQIETTRAMIRMHEDDVDIRLAAIRTLSTSGDVAVAQLLEPFANDKTVDARVSQAAQAAVRDINSRLAQGEILHQVFTGVSLGSVLLLAALGLAVVYGLMGVINMAHGELIMIGAYATYLTQNLIRSQFPGLFEFYPLLAIPASFLAAALVGILLERLVIRFLYGRPLETLLATWGISLILIQSVRLIFGQQNVTVENPAWLSGGIEIYSNLILTYNRLAIIAFAAIVLVTVTLLLTRTRMGLYVRAVTQNRSMARCMGVRSAWVDTLTFGLGAGLAGLAGCALAQIGNVGPELGQGYIVDSFMVVVLGGVGQLAGAVYASLGLGILSKFIEGFAGAELAKIAILVAVIIFIQKRPQGIFALKGRVADA